MAAIHDKIVHLLDARRLRRRDLARELGVSPQTATDICKGRSAVTLPHLRSLVRMFALRPDYWLDDTRLEPDAIDRVSPKRRRQVEGLERGGFLSHPDPATLCQRLRSFAIEHGEAFRTANPDLSADDFAHLDLPSNGGGMVGRVGG